VNPAVRDLQNRERPPALMVTEGVVVTPARRIISSFSGISFPFLSGSISGLGFWVNPVASFE